MISQMFPPEDRPYSCADVMGATGISRNALFNYERHGIARPQRGANGYRAYSLGDVLDIMCCTMLLSMGYSVSEAAEVLRNDDVMGIGPIDTHLERLERQRDVAQAKVDNLYALRSVITEALPPEQAPLHLVECPPWLFFFDTPPAERPKNDSDPRFSGRCTREAKGAQAPDSSADSRFINQIQLMRSVPLSCRGFVIEDFWSEKPCFCWARTLRECHKHLLDVDASNAVRLAGPCLRTVIKADYPDLDSERILRSRMADWLAQADLRMTADPFVPLLFNNRMPSPVFEIYIPVEKVAGSDAMSECGI